MCVRTPARLAVHHITSAAHLYSMCFREAKKEAPRVSIPDTTSPSTWSTHTSCISGQVRITPAPTLAKLRRRCHTAEPSLLRHRSKMSAATDPCTPCPSNDRICPSVTLVAADWSAANTEVGSPAMFAYCRKSHGVAVRASHTCPFGEQSSVGQMFVSRKDRMTHRGGGRSASDALLARQLRTARVALPMRKTVARSGCTKRSIFHDRTRTLCSICCRLESCILSAL